MILIDFILLSSLISTSQDGTVKHILQKTALSQINPERIEGNSRQTHKKPPLTIPPPSFLILSPSYNTRNFFYQEDAPCLYLFIFRADLPSQSRPVQFHSIPFPIPYNTVQEFQYTQETLKV